jgi:outer membrane protein OmpA-like peptidoglycan-associated protein
MRFVIFSIFSVLWVVMWWWTYTCHDKLVCCPGYAEKMAATGQVATDESRPLLFQWADAKPIVTPAFEGLRDSLLAMVGENESLRVTGFAFRDEESGDEDLGEARARAIAALLFGDGIDIVVRGETASLSGDVRDQLFEAATFEVVNTARTFSSMPDTMTLYFDQDAATFDLDTGITAYIQHLVERLRNTDETILLTGHWDDRGSADANYSMALERATIFGDLLEEAGIPSTHIQVESKGEEDY